MVKLYIDVDASGEITTSLAGEFVINDKEYDYLFVVDDYHIPENISNYYVDNGELKEKESK